MKVISFGELTAEEKKEIYKAFVRFHKEHGTMPKIKEKGLTLSWFEHFQDNATVHNKFVEIIWTPVRQHYLDIGELRDLEICIKASIETIKFAEQFYYSKNKKFRRIGNYTIFNEFDFFFNKVSSSSPKDLESCPTILKEEFRELWLSHKDVTTPGNGWRHTITDKYKDFFPDK
jgi:hypothetical protein